MRSIFTFLFAIVGMTMIANPNMPVSHTDSLSIADCDELPLYDSSYPNDLIEINAHASAGISSLRVNYGGVVPGLTDFMLSPGLQLKGGVDVAFVLRNSFTLSTGMDFGINNSRYAVSIVDSKTNSISSIYVRNHFYDLTVPVYLTWRLNLGRRVKWLFDAGFYMAWGIGGNLKASGYNSGENSLGQPIVTHASYKTDYFKSDSPLINSVSDFDYGPRGGIGFLYQQRISLKLIFQISAKNLVDSENVLGVRYRNLCLAGQLGYSF